MTKRPDTGFSKGLEDVLLCKGAGVSGSIDFEEVCFVE
jgi:hypothetical protein